MNKKRTQRSLLIMLPDRRTWFGGSKWSNAVTKQNLKTKRKQKQKSVLAKVAAAGHRKWIVES